MLKDQRKWFASAIWKPIKSNLPAVMFVGGTVMLGLGALFDVRVDELLRPGAGKMAQQLGGAILGAGVFSAIMKSVQFTELFKQHITDVFYDPARALDDEQLLKQWRLITNGILGKVLSSFREEATKAIEKQFFNSELEYHYEGLTMKYDIVVDPATRTAHITNTTTADIIISPGVEEPVFKYRLDGDGEVKLEALFLNDIDCLEHEQLKKYKSCQNRLDLVFKLNDFCDINDGNIGKVKLERRNSWTQILPNNPNLTVSLTRYVRGATVDVCLTGGYKIIFEKLSYDAGTKCKGVPNGPCTRWVLASSRSLLLPGQGFIIMVVP